MLSVKSYNLMDYKDDQNSTTNNGVDPHSCSLKLNFNNDLKKQFDELFIGDTFNDQLPSSNNLNLLNKLLENQNLYNNIKFKTIQDIIKNTNKYRTILNKSIDIDFLNYINDNNHLSLNNYTLLYLNNKLYNIYLTECSIKENKNKEIILQIIYSYNTNDLILWFKRGRIDMKNNKIKISDNTNSGINFYNIYDYDLCIDKYKKLFNEFTGYSWDNYNNIIEYEKNNNKYKIINIKTLNNEDDIDSDYISDKQYPSPSANLLEERSQIDVGSTLTEICDLELSNDMPSFQLSPTTMSSNHNVENKVISYIKYDLNTEIFINNIIKYNNRNNNINLYHNYKLKTNNITEKKLIDGLNILNKIKKIYNDQQLFNKVNLIKENVINHINLINIEKLTEDFLYCIPITCGNDILINLNEDLIDRFIDDIIDIIPYINYDVYNKNNVFNKLYNNIIKLSNKDKLYTKIYNYVNLNKGLTFLHEYDFEIIDIYKLKNKILEEEDSTSLDLKNNNQYLFHGTRYSNLLSILNNGLKIAPDNIPRSGSMFGNGLYFANCSTKSFNYTLSQHYNEIGCLLLCKVKLGESYKLNRANYNAEDIIKNSTYNSIHGVGKYTPDIQNHVDYNKADISTNMPIGKLIKSKDFNNLYLDYDEFIIYDTNQVNIEYIINIKKIPYNNTFNY